MAWRTDFENLPKTEERSEAKFDVIVRNHKGEQWRVVDCIVNASRQICSYDRDWGYEPIEYNYGIGEFQRVTHWMKVDPPPLEDKGRPG